MFPHPNHLPRWLNRLLLLTGAALLLTGLGWDAVHFTIGAGSADAMPAPAEIWLMRGHGLAMLGFMVALGGLGPVHVPRGWRQKRNRGSGLVLCALAVLLLATGYALYYFAGDGSRETIGLAHAAAGTVMALLVLWHRTAQTRREAQA